MIQELLKKIETRKATIGVIGLGYVGLPLVREFTRGGAKVIGFDVDPKKVRMLKAGRSYIAHIPSETVKDMVRSEYLRRHYDPLSKEVRAEVLESLDLKIYYDHMPPI